MMRLLPDIENLTTDSPPKSFVYDTYFPNGQGQA